MVVVVADRVVQGFFTSSSFNHLAHTGHRSVEDNHPGLHIQHTTFKENKPNQTSRLKTKIVSSPKQSDSELFPKEDQSAGSKMMTCLLL